jgi:hypothetical protein
MRPQSLILLVATTAVAAACGDTLGLGRAQVPNAVATVSLYAVSGTAVSRPSAYRILNSTSGFAVPGAVRTDQTSDFDFVFDIDTLGRALLLPTAAVQLGRASGTQLVVADFDSLALAPDRNYNLDSALVLEPGTVAVVHSRSTTCPSGIGAAYYAKIFVVTIDPSSDPNGRRVDLKILVDQNCGYRGLALGLPTR